MHEARQLDRQEEAFKEARQGAHLEQGPRLRRGQSAAQLTLFLLAAALAVSATGAEPSEALITPPVTLDGPSSSILDFGGVAMASDGTGGLVYVKSVAGVPHVFASRFGAGRWSAPTRVDWDRPYPARQPRIAAGPHGELLVVWVTELATVHGQIRFGLYSATIGPGASRFGRAQLVDGNVGDGTGVSPSLAATAPGQAIVAYRVITYKFDRPGFSTAVQLRPGDVMAEIRLARLNGDRWARLGAVNRNPEASMRPPSPTNGPQVAAGNGGGAAVAWQEPDQTGVARIWLRRVFGTSPGPVLEASPANWESRPVTADADALAVAVSPLLQVRVAMRIAAGSDSPLSGRLLLNSLPPNRSLTAGHLTGAVIADGGAGGSASAIGPPSVAAVDEGGAEGSMRLSFVGGGQLHQLAVDGNGALTAVPTPPEPSAEPGGEAIAAVGPEEDGVAAYVAGGGTAVAVRQEYPSGAAQTGLVGGGGGGPVAALSVGRSGLGDGLVGFIQGEVGHSAVVAEWVSAPPSAFRLTVPSGWVKPRRARLRWKAARSAVGGLRYAVLVDGRVVKRRLKRLAFRVAAGQLGTGVSRVRVVATDALGQQQQTAVAKLRVDSQPPRVLLHVRRSTGVVRLRVRDANAGLLATATRVWFGDGSRARRGSSFKHAYPHGGRYRILVRARDRVGNRTLRRFEVTVR